MKEFTLDLVKNYQRPIIKLYGITTLIDTGAVIPTVSLPIPILEKAFNAQLVLSEARIGGFGGDCKGKVFSLENFRVGILEFSTIEFFVPDIPVTKHPFLLSASMFYGMEYDFNTFDSKFTVYIPDNIPLKREFKLKDLDGKLYAQVDGALLQENIKEGTYIDNYTQFEVALDKAVSEVLEKHNIDEADVDLDNNIMLE